MSWGRKIATARNDREASALLNQAIGSYTAKLMEIYKITPMDDMPILLTAMHGVYDGIMESVPDPVRRTAHHVMDHTATVIISTYGGQHGTG